MKSRTVIVTLEIGTTMALDVLGDRASWRLAPLVNQECLLTDTLEIRSADARVAQPVKVNAATGRRKGAKRAGRSR